MRSAMLLLCGAMLLSSCISISGGETTVKEVPGTTTTLGQRLMDLKAEYDRGAISEQEYNQRRQRLLQGG
jgi:Short C-terminal domain